MLAISHLMSYDAISLKGEPEMTKQNTITVARRLAEQASVKEGVRFTISEYPGNRRIINDGGKRFIDGRDGREYFAYGISTPTKFYAFRNRAAQCEWLADRL